MMKKTLLLLLTLASAAALLLKPEAASAAVREGIALCIQTVIPSLFPFLVLTALLVRLGAAEALGGVLAPFMGPLFSVSGLCAAPLLAGLMGGYPAGAAAAAQLYRQRRISRKEAETCLAFVNNCGPAFILSFVGQGIFRSSAIGILLYLIHVLSALLTGFFLRFLPQKASPRPSSEGKRVEQNDETLPAMVTASVSDAVSAQARVCAFVILFHAAAAFWQLPPFPLGLLELVSGISALSPTKLGFVFAAGLLGWGGLSVHCQTMAVIGTLSPRRYLLGKTVQMALSLLLAALFVQFAPNASCYFP